MSLAAIRQTVTHREIARDAQTLVHIARYVMLARGRLQNASVTAQADGHADAALILRSSVAAGTLTTNDSIAQFPGIFSAFLESLRNLSAFDAMKSDMRIVPLRSRVLLVSTGATGLVPGEGEARSVSQLSLATSTMALKTATAIVAATENLLKEVDGDADRLFESELRGAVAQSTDETFVAALTAELSPVTSSGTSALAAWNDIANALYGVATSAASKLWVLMTPLIAKQMSTLYSSGRTAFPGMSPTGGTIMNMPAFVTDGMPAGQIVIADARQIVAADDGGMLDSATAASLQMEDTAPDSPATGSTTLVSFFQQGLVGLKFARHFSVDRPRSGSVAVISGANYTADSP